MGGWLSVMDYGFTLGVIVILLIIAGIALLVVKACDESAKAKGEEYYKEYNRQVNENLKKQEFGKGYGIKCPNCGQENVKYISTASRAISVGAVGLASNKIGKTYKCPKCGYMW